MIPRYTRPEMAAVWTDQSRYEIWLEVETLALEQLVAENLAPPSALEAVRAKGRFDVERVLAIEAEVKHDVIAFLTNVAEHAGPEARFLHRGMTSSDLIDTAFAVQLQRAGKLIAQGLTRAKESVKRRAIEFKYTPCVGRSHGIHAEPTTFGLKLLSWYSELQRATILFDSALKQVMVGKISGAVGTFASIPPSVEAHVTKRLGLTAEPVSTQIVPRDRHAVFFSALSMIASSIERFSVEIRHLQRTEVGEAQEKFTSGQKGSSAMPHKRNPILSENLSGLARLVRGYALSAAENIALWHERDISHSSVERVIAPDACIVIDFMLARFAALVDGLVVNPDRMLSNLNMTRGLVFSGTLLLALVDHGFTREHAYKITQRHALEAWDGGASLKERVENDSEVAIKLSKAQIEEIFDLKRHINHVDLIFERTLE